MTSSASPWLWVTAVRQGMESRTYFWPGDEVKIRGVRPTQWFPYDAKVSYNHRVDTVAKW